jgi:hypothetical protein
MDPCCESPQVSGSNCEIEEGATSQATIDESVDARGDGGEANRVWRFKWTQRRETWDFVCELFGVHQSRIRQKAFRMWRAAL